MVYDWLRKIKNKQKQNKNKKQKTKQNKTKNIDFIESTQKSRSVGIAHIFKHIWIAIWLRSLEILISWSWYTPFSRTDNIKSTHCRPLKEWVNYSLQILCQIRHKLIWKQLMEFKIGKKNVKRWFFQHCKSSCTFFYYIKSSSSTCHNIPHKTSNIVEHLNWNNIFTCGKLPDSVFRSL